MNFTASFTYKGFEAVAGYSFEDEVFVGRVQNSTDIISFHSTQPDKLEKEFHAAIEEYLDLQKELGRSPSLQSGKFNYRPGSQRHSQIATAAAAHSQSINDWLNSAVDRQLLAPAQTSVQSGSMTLQYHAKMDLSNVLPFTGKEQSNWIKATSLPASAAG